MTNTPATRGTRGKTQPMVSLVDVPPADYLKVSGAGNPNTGGAYQEAVEALYSVSYALRFALRRRLGVTEQVRPLEGLWLDDPGKPAAHEPRWTMMIEQPAVASLELVYECIEEVRRKKPLPALQLVRFETFHEGLVAQVLHVGPFHTEEVSVARLRAFMRENGLVERGVHHEIYFSDLRRVPPEKWRTLLRHPVRPA